MEDSSVIEYGKVAPARRRIASMICLIMGIVGVPLTAILWGLLCHFVDASKASVVLRSLIPYVLATPLLVVLTTGIYTLCQKNSQTVSRKLAWWGLAFGAFWFLVGVLI